MQALLPHLEKTVHPWLRRSRVVLIPGPSTPLLEQTLTGLAAALGSLGQEVLPRPLPDTDAIITTAPFGEPLSWRRALMFCARSRYRLNRQPTVFTLVHATPAQVDQLLEQLEGYIAQPRPRRDLCDYPGLAPKGHEVLFEQGRRGGPMLALLRLVQAQAKSIRAVLVVGEDQPEAAYHFDLAGAHPRTVASDLDEFYQDMALRIITALSTREVTEHTTLEQPIPASQWQSLQTPAGMIRAGHELGRRGFFTKMLVISELVQLPALNDAVASQYSEGCFATWDPNLGALIATVTGSARPVDKGSLSEEDLAVLVGVRPEGTGALVRPVEGKVNHPPSSEAVEMLEADEPLPRIGLGLEWGTQRLVPVVRSKLHGHRGVEAYDPAVAEYAPLDEAYQRYPVGCATDAQARAIKAAFSRARALQDPNDPRQIVFTILPGHGTILLEKWVAGKAPFQVLWEAMDDGTIRIASRVPQGLLHYVPDSHGLMTVRAAD
jgi:hypothetical protein